MKLISYRAFYWEKKERLAKSCNFTFRYITDVLSLNNSKVSDYVDRIYPIGLEINDTTETGRSASNLNLHLEIDSKGWLRSKLYDKRDDFDFPFMSSNIPAVPANKGEISQLIRFLSEFYW